jgi:hypothetical protein
MYKRDKVSGTFFCLLSNFRPMAHELFISHDPPDRNVHLSPAKLSPCEFSVRSTSYVVDMGKFHAMTNKLPDPSPVGELRELSRLLRIKEPEYTVYTIHGWYYACNVEVGNRFFASTTPRDLPRHAKEDAAGLALHEALNNPSAFATWTITEELPIVSSVSALNELCHNKPWEKPGFTFVRGFEGRWKCICIIVKGTKIIRTEGMESFKTKRDAKKDAAMAMYLELSN